MSNFTVCILSASKMIPLDVLKAARSLPKLQCYEKRVVRTVNNGANDLMNLSIFCSVRTLKSLTDGLCESRNSSISEGLESRSSKGRSRRLAQGTGNAADDVLVDVQASFCQTRGSTVRGTYVLSMLADGMRMVSGEKRVFVLVVVTELRSSMKVRAPCLALCFT